MTFDPYRQQRPQQQPPWGEPAPPPERPQYEPRWNPERYDPDEHYRRTTMQQQFPPEPQQPSWPPLPPQAAPRRAPRWLPWAATAAAVVILGGAAGAYALTRPGKPLTCPQQYAAWKNGPAAEPAKSLLNSDGNALQAAASDDDIPKMDSALKQFGQDAQKLQAYPMPACADPAGYWAQVLGKISAAGDNAGSTPGLGGLMTAMAPLQQLKPVEAKLDAELARTAGVKSAA